MAKKMLGKLQWAHAPRKRFLSPTKNKQVTNACATKELRYKKIILGKRWLWASSQGALWKALGRYLGGPGGLWVSSGAPRVAWEILGALSLSNVQTS